MSEQHHRFVPDEGIYCGKCGANRGVFGPKPRWWTCGQCGTPGPVDDIDLIPGLAAEHPKKQQ